MSFATLANENGITMLNGECAVDTGVMPQLTRKGMVVFCEQFGITYQERMENDFRIKIFINTYNAMIYKLYAREEDLKRYLPVEDMTYPECNKESLGREIVFLSDMFVYLNTMMLKPSQKFLWNLITRTIEGNRHSIKAIEDREIEEEEQQRQIQEANRLAEENSHRAEVEQHNVYILPLSAFACLFLGIILFFNNDTAEFGLFLIVIFFILSIISPFVMAAQSRQNINIRHKYGVYDRKKDIQDNVTAVGCMAIGLKGLHNTKKGVHDMTFGDGVHHKI